ncbi:MULTISPECIES: hypothetical protein [Cohaesibacter]|uniref:hypothetical protein n=1 Tax=Cohaesibacter TaxID=655352 RepID=UPI000DEA8B12|nr:MULTISPECIES: hypothetical protein [Cohaesibacter]TLP48188.1 hypothetical protein FDK21_00525 [Cohaesibacter sp. CAU 1516]
MMELYETLIETISPLILHRDTPEGAFTCLVSFANIAQVRAMAKDVGAKEEWPPTTKHPPSNKPSFQENGPQARFITMGGINGRE